VCEFSIVHQKKSLLPANQIGLKEKEQRPEAHKYLKEIPERGNNDYIITNDTMTIKIGTAKN
jgi:hypothetical protein